MEANLYFYAFKAMTHDKYIRRCFQLASLGKGMVEPNPLVGAVLVHEDRIIGEGYHTMFGGPHAEVNCIQSVTETDTRFIQHSTLYVSLEPCNHHGKTPPCTDLILKSGIKRVVISVTDPFDQVNGTGIEKLRNAGVEVITDVLREEGLKIIQPFYTYHFGKRPYIILKWAQTADGMMGSGSNERLKISSPETDLLVHRWRSEVSGIAIGTNTALKDNPQLNTRLWPGKSPVRILLDKSLKVPEVSKILDGSIPTLIYNEINSGEVGMNKYIKLSAWNLDSLLESWYAEGLQSVLIEGGAALLSSFMHNRKFDEIRLITNTEMYFPKGLKAPALPPVTLTSESKIGKDLIQYFQPLI